MIRFEDVLIREDYIGYAWVYRRYADMNYIWVLEIKFMNDNQHQDYLQFKYETEKEAKAKLNKLEELLK